MMWILRCLMRYSRCVCVQGGEMFLCFILIFLSARISIYILFFLLFSLVFSGL